MGYTRLTSDKKAEVLKVYLHNGNLYQTAEKTGVSAGEVKFIISTEENSAIIDTYCKELKEGIKKSLWEKVRVALDAMTEDKIKAGTLNQLVPVIGMCIEKALLVSGEATQIMSDVENLTQREISQGIRDILQRRPSMKKYGIVAHEAREGAGNATGVTRVRQEKEVMTDEEYKAKEEMKAKYEKIIDGKE